MRNKIFKIIGIIALFLLLGVSVLCEAIISPVSAIEGARASIVMEANFKKVLYEDNIHMRLPMASTTKITTAIVAIENYPELDHEFEVNPSAIGIEGTSIYLKQNEKMTMRELLLGLMLASGNDCAVAIACEVAGSEAKFVDMMNDFVVDKLGLSDTHYDNPHGLDSDTHYTSAYDLAYITSYALDNPIFCEIVGTKNATIRGNDEVEARYLKHKNRLLFTDTNCIGVKTGFTDNAGRCLVHATKKDNMTLVSVVLNCPDMFNACDALDRVARDEYVCHTLLEPYTIIGYANVIDGDITKIGLVNKNGYSDVIKSRDIDKYTLVYNIPTEVTAPLREGERVGSIDVCYSGEVVSTIDVYLVGNAENIDLKYYLDTILNNWI